MVVTEEEKARRFEWGGAQGKGDTIVFAAIKVLMLHPSQNKESHDALALDGRHFTIKPTINQYL
jgi:hypothetical protein